MIHVRVTRWSTNFVKAEHQDFEISDLAFWEPPRGWMVACIAIGDKGLPPWEDEIPAPKLGTKEAAKFMPPSERIIHTEADFGPDGLLA